jgi:hypothetical protein
VHCGLPPLLVLGLVTTKLTKKGRFVYLPVLPANTDFVKALRYRSRESGR